ncbi:uncharacterized protein BJ212DRAFT_1299116 [Suillus subaureus]|uniref:Uncharacterized protein n=1 Tax=Suillus subaureus TaxID=48587 RepID=A0A9P7ECP2_9AGAM|nr:uncharacterized protein BJ212DRAFT_1299116 [Suillus subaureus]KAG1817572.1 hypothetical protein BJ212DRAFT_1299116 [Suillus subaureus]
MARSGHSTQLTSGRHRACQPQTQKLTENEISELKNYLPEWTLAKRKEKQAVFTAIARAARKKKERKDMIKYGRKWMPRMVIYQWNQEEVLKRIEDKSRAKPGGPSMFKHYQAAVKRVMAELSNDELEKVKEIAEGWSDNFPPPEIQVQVTRKKGPVYMEYFSKEMWRQCGMRVFVMLAWKNEQGEVLFRMHNDNEALGDGDSFMKMKDWEDIKPVWQEYMQEQFGARAWDGGQQMKRGQKRIRKPAFELETNGDGMLLLSDITNMKLEEKKAIDDFVAKKYVPADVDLKEPSKLQNWNTTALLNFWHAQQEKADGRSLQKRPRREPGPLTAHEGTAVPCAIPKPRPVKLAKTGALLTSQMGDLLAGLTDRVTGNVGEDVAMEGGHMSLAPKNMWGKKAAIEPLARTTWSKSTQQPSDNTPQVTRARGKK